MRCEAIKVFGPDIGGIVHAQMIQVAIHGIIADITREFDLLAIMCIAHLNVNIEIDYCEIDLVQPTSIRINTHSSIWYAILCEITTSKIYKKHDHPSPHSIIDWKDHRFLVCYDDYRIVIY